MRSVATAAVPDLREAGHRGAAPVAASLTAPNRAVGDPAYGRSRRPRLQTALEHLAEADLLFVEGAPPNASYRFRHALIRDAAYESLAEEPAPGAASPRR